MIQLLKDADLRRRLGAAGRQRYERLLRCLLADRRQQRLHF